MNKRIITIFFLLAASLSQAQQVERQDDEDVRDFVKRIMPEDLALAHHVIETYRWSYPRKIVVACYGYVDSANTEPEAGVFTKIDGHVYLPTGKNTYRDIQFGPIEEDGGYPDIVAIFFANADKDTAKELIVLCKYVTKNYDFEGAVYRTFIYDNPGPADKLVYMEDISRLFTGMEGLWRDGKINKAKYRTAKEIKLKLSQMRH